MTNKTWNRYKNSIKIEDSTTQDNFAKELLANFTHYFNETKILEINMKIMRSYDTLLTFDYIKNVRFIYKIFAIYSLIYHLKIISKIISKKSR